MDFVEKMNMRSVIFGEHVLTAADVDDIAHQRARVVLSQNEQVRNRWQRGADFVDRLLSEDGVIYGVTTGYGDSCTVSIPSHLVNELSERLFTYHGCGTGEYLSSIETRAVLVARLCSLSQGFSGVSVGLLEGLAALLEYDILPLIPSEGSVGASGDLTPSSYIAAVLCGRRDVMFRGEVVPASQALAICGLKPLTLRPKEGLALMNGTAVMTGLACLAIVRAEYIAKLSSRITAMVSIALDGNPSHFDARLFSVKPHIGQQQFAARVSSDLDAVIPSRNDSRLQDRYSVRCAPHVTGVLEDALPWLKTMVENELNSANDNPIIDPDSELVLHGGHFYGGHIAFACDSLKNLIANIADLHDRQLALLVDKSFNNGLPSNLSGANDERAAINHGLKAVQIAASSWAAEALKLTMPASVFSRSTECHNQDKVSMGTISARDCMRVMVLSEQVIAAMLIACNQGVRLRESISPISLTGSVRTFIELIAQDTPFIVEDRELDVELRSLSQSIRMQKWNLYE